MTIKQCCTDDGVDFVSAVVALVGDIGSYNDVRECVRAAFAQSLRGLEPNAIADQLAFVSRLASRESARLENELDALAAFVARRVSRSPDVDEQTLALARFTRAVYREMRDAGPHTFTNEQNANDNKAMKAVFAANDD